MSSTPQNASDASSISALRDRVRGALLAKKKGEARDLLGRLVALSGDPEDMTNLSNLISGVDDELHRHLRSWGEIRTRLSEGTPLESIQSELDNSIPHWRAFVNDLPGLSLARNGLPPSDDPNFRAQVDKLESRLAEGEVEAVLEAWKDLGAPPGTCSAGFAQITELLARLDLVVKEKEWKKARSVHSECGIFLEDEELSLYREGISSYLRRRGERIGWETLLIECKDALPHPSTREKQRLASALYAAIDTIERRLVGAGDPSLAELRNRLCKMRQAVEVAEPNATKEASGVKWILLGLLVLLTILAGLWLYQSSSAEGFEGASGVETSYPSHRDSRP